jgi:hypothetical protein
MQIFKISACLAWCMAAALLGGCSTQAWYEGVKRSAEIECNKQPAGALESCSARVNRQPYDDYEKERSAR